MKNLPLIALLLIYCLAISCGSKKKLSSRELERISTTEKTDIVKTVTVLSNARILTDSIGKKTTYEPIDPDKPSRVGDTEFQNTRITSEDTDLKKEETKSDSTTSQLKDNSTSKNDSVKRSRKTDVKDSRIPWYAWLLGGLAVVLIAVAWIRWRA